MSYTSATTELEAVNEMLRSVGESPVASISDSAPLPADADIALRALRWTNREVQTRPWHWNTERRYPLPINPDGFIVVPNNTLAADPDGDFADVDAVVRGSRLYDRENHTYVFEKGITATVTLLLPFEQLPEAARTYIALRAARKFQQGAVGSQILSGYTEADEVEARLHAEYAESDGADWNILTGSQDTQDIVDRRL